MENFYQKYQDEVTDKVPEELWQAALETAMPNYYCEALSIIKNSLVSCSFKAKDLHDPLRKKFPDKYITLDSKYKTRYEHVKGAHNIKMGINKFLKKANVCLRMRQRSLAQYAFGTRGNITYQIVVITEK